MSSVEHRDLPDDETAARFTADIARYAGVTIRLANNPDRPGALVSGTEVNGRAPCYIAVAKALRQIADEFEGRHGIEGRR